MICHVWGFKSTLAQMCAGDTCLYWAILIIHKESQTEKRHSVWHKETNLAGNNLDSRRDGTKLFSNSTQLTAWSLMPRFKVTLESQPNFTIDVSFWSCHHGTLLPSFSRPTMVASFLHSNTGLSYNSNNSSAVADGDKCHHIMLNLMLNYRHWSTTSYTVNVCPAAEYTFLSWWHCCFSLHVKLMIRLHLHIYNTIIMPLVRLHTASSPAAVHGLNCNKTSFLQDSHIHHP